MESRTDTSPEPDRVPSTVWLGPFAPEHFERDFMAFLRTRNGVAVLTWPRDRERAEQLARAGVPCLFVVPPTATPCGAPRQAWLPIDSSRAEVFDCLLDLSRMAARQRDTARPPTLDADGRLHFNEAHVPIPPPERTLVGRLVDAFEVPVARSVLNAATPDPGALPHLLHDVDLRANPLGLGVHPAPGGGYLLCRASITAVPPRRPSPAPVPAAPSRKLGHRRTLPMHFRSGLLAPDLP